MPAILTRILETLTWSTLKDRLPLYIDTEKNYWWYYNQEKIMYQISMYNVLQCKPNRCLCAGSALLKYKLKKKKIFHIMSKELNICIVWSRKPENSTTWCPSLWLEVWLFTCYIEIFFENNYMKFIINITSKLLILYFKGNIKWTYMYYQVWMYVNVHNDNRNNLQQASVMTLARKSSLPYCLLITALRIAFNASSLQVRSFTSSITKSENTHQIQHKLKS
jgi:hypothetical protein